MIKVKFNGTEFLKLTHTIQNRCIFLNAVTFSDEYNERLQNQFFRLVNLFYFVFGFPPGEMKKKTVNEKTQTRAP